jgi:hypothetical protein
VVATGFTSNSSGAILRTQQVFTLFLKALEKQQESSLRAGFLAQKLGTCCADAGGESGAKPGFAYVLSSPAAARAARMDAPRAIFYKYLILLCFYF